jgi:ABC-2 type transport system ATP-binding protein
LGTVARTELRQLLFALARKGKTVILSSSSLEEIKDLCNRVAVYDGGKVEALGPVFELLTTPAALRFLVPVVSSAVAEELLRTLREQLGSAAASPVERPASTVPQARSAQDVADPAAAAADEILARLVQAPGPELPSAQEEETDSTPVTGSARTFSRVPENSSR